MHTFFKRRLRQVLVGSIIFTVGLVSFPFMVPER